MIIDKLFNINNNYNFNKSLSTALDYLKEHDLKSISDGVHEIHSKDIYLIASEYFTKSSEECFLEGHKRYIDVQYVVSGYEWIGYTPFENQDVVRKYDSENDYVLYKGDASFVKLEAGMFAVFYPNDLHMPGTGSENNKVKKIVIKVKI